MPLCTAANLSAYCPRQSMWSDPITEALGPRPREALSALVGYGLSDTEIARYNGLPNSTISYLRSLWNIRSEA